MPGRKRTYQPHKRRRKSVHGFRQRMQTASGRKVLASRRKKGRHGLTMTGDKKVLKPSVYVSYAVDDERLANKIQADLVTNGFNLITGDNYLIESGSVYELMKKSTKVYIILLISNYYVRSKFCMQEFKEITRDINFYNRCFPILTNLNILNPEKISEYKRYWKNKIAEIESSYDDADLTTDGKVLRLKELNIASASLYQFSQMEDIFSKMNILEYDESSDGLFNHTNHILEKLNSI